MRQYRTSIRTGATAKGNSTGKSYPYASKKSYLIFETLFGKIQTYNKAMRNRVAAFSSKIVAL
ncbi:MAG: hypothetical protein K2G19_09930, partial [Lachnospiraceae bacterium]|nr:hypothetical protein [Lachnospiraceae bacterium]